MTLSDSLCLFGRAGPTAVRSLVLDAVKQNGGAFAYADPVLRADRGRAKAVLLLNLYETIESFF